MLADARRPNDWRNAQRSQDVQEVIGTPANWLARYGTALLMVIVLALVALSFFYTYPTVVSGELVLTTVDPPRPLLARQGFNIERVLVGNRDTVEAGETILVAAYGRARFEHVLSLEDQLLALRGADVGDLLALTLDPGLVLGQIQESVYNFQDKQEVYRSLTARSLDGLTTRELEARIADRERYIRRQRALQSRLEDELSEDRVRLAREEQLLQDGLNNGDQLSNAQRRVEKTEEELQRSIGNLRAASFDIEIMRNQIESYRSGRPGSAKQAATALRDAFDDLETAVANWKRDFTVVSPVHGTVILAPDVRQDGFIFEKGLMATVLPLNAGGIVGRLTLDIRGSGKVAPGQRVLVRFANWPHLEYGSVDGEVVEKSVIPTEQGKIAVEVAFPRGLRTTTGYDLEPSPYMQGSASVITERRRLLSRFVDAF